MADQPLTSTALPRERELAAFAHAAAQLLAGRPSAASGARTVRRRSGSGLQYLDHRDYLPGDELRHIDWRQTARRRRPILKRFEAESSNDWFMLLDASSSMATGGATKWLAAVTATAAMSYALLDLGHRVGLLVHGHTVLAEIPPGRGHAHYAAIARQLAASRPRDTGERSSFGACVRRLRGSCSVLVLSDFLGLGQPQRELAGLRERSVELQALRLWADADQWLPNMGRYELVDVETGDRLAIDVTPALMQQAALTQVATGRQLGSLCRRMQVAFTDWHVADPWQPVLLNHLSQAQSMC
jgi:uncharacterized protein (DUF58 family)